MKSLVFVMVVICLTVVAHGVPLKERDLQAGEEFHPPHPEPRSPAERPAAASHHDHHLAHHHEHHQRHLEHHYHHHFGSVSHDHHHHSVPLQGAEVKPQLLTDSTFEHHTQAASGGTSGNWLVLFVPDAATEESQSTQTAFEQFLGTSAASSHQVVAGWVNCGSSSSAETCRRFHRDGRPSAVLIQRGKYLSHEITPLTSDSVAQFLDGAFALSPDDPVWIAVPQVESVFDRVQPFLKDVLLRVLAKRYHQLGRELEELREDIGLFRFDRSFLSSVVGSIRSKPMVMLLVEVVAWGVFVMSAVCCMCIVLWRSQRPARRPAPRPTAAEVAERKEK